MRSLLLALPILVAMPAAAQQAAHGSHASHDAKAAHGAPTKGTASRTLTIVAKDFSYEAPETVQAGITEIRLKNAGPELHHVQLIRLEQGKTFADLGAAMQSHGPPPAWAKDVGGPNTPVPGGESVATVDLTPGNYAIVCFIPSPQDGQPHVAKGMAKPLTVVAGPATARPVANAAAKAPAITMTLLDYGFQTSKPITAGTHTIRVKNAAAQSHEVFFAQLAPGKTAMDLIQWIEKPQGPPPGKPMGGTTGMQKDGWNDVTVTFEPGEYALICFIPDAKDGKPHFVHGMVRQITVK